MGALIKAYDADRNPLGYLPDYSGLVTQRQFNDTGLLTFAYDPTGRHAALLSRDILFLSIVENGVEGDAIYRLDEDSDDIAAGSGEDVLVNVVARGIMAELDSARMYPAGHTPGMNVSGLDPKNEFKDSTFGQIFAACMTAAKNRGALRNLDVSFSASHDSAGTPWAKQHTVTYTAGMSYLEILRAACDNGWVRASTTGFKLDLFNHDDTPNAGAVVLRTGQQVRSGPRKRSRRGIVSTMLGLGSEKNIVEAHDTTATAKYGRREGFASDGRMTESGSLTALTQYELARLTEAKEGFTLSLASGDRPPNSVPLPSWRTNHALYPRPTAVGTRWLYQAGTGGEVSAASIATGIGPDGEAGVAFFRRTITTPKTGGVSGIYYRSNPGELFGNKLDYITGSMWVRSSHAAAVTLEIQPRLGAASAGVATGPTTTLPANTWVRLSATARASDAFDGFQAWAKLAATTILPAGATIDATSVLLEFGQNVGEYFSGATTNTSDWSYLWSGAVDASKAHAWPVPLAARVNLASNPRALVPGRWSYSGGNEVGANTFEREIGPGGMPGFFRRSVTTAKTASSTGVTYVEPVSGVAGDTVTASFYQRCSAQIDSRLRLSFRKGNVVVGTADMPAAATLLPGVDTLLQVTATATGDYDNVYLWAYQFAQTPIPDGGTLDSSCCLIERAAVREPFFDGDTVPHANVTYGWVGARGASPSYEQHRVLEVWPEPGIDYDVGDWILWDDYLNTAGDALEPLRVRTITNGWTASDFERTTELELNDVFVEHGIQLERRVTGITQGSVTAAPPPTVEYKPDVTTPLPPGSISLTAEIYASQGPDFKVAATATWDPVTSNVDGTSYDDHDVYLVAWSITNGAHWTASADVQEPIAWFGELPPGKPFMVRVATRDIAGHVSPWRTSGVLNLPVDNVPPPPPAPPIVTSRLGSMEIVWNGLTSDGKEQPSDYWHSEVYYRRAGTTTATKAGTITPNGTLVLTTLPYNITYQFWVESLDRSRNRSLPSEMTAGTVTPLVDTDVIGQIIKDANIVSIDGTKLHPLSVETTSIKVGSPNVYPDPGFLDPALCAARTANSGGRVTFGDDPTNGRYMEIDFTSDRSSIYLSPDGSGDAWLDVAAYRDANGYLIGWPITYKAILTQTASTFSTYLTVVPEAYNPTTKQWVAINPSGVANLTLSTTDIGVLKNAWGTYQSGIIGPGGDAALPTKIRLAMRPRDGVTTAYKIRIFRPEMRRGMHGVNISEGSVTAYALAAMSVTADKIEGNAINGKIITGATIRTTEARNRGVIMKSSGIEAYDAAGTQTVLLDASTGSLTMTGSVYTSTGAASAHLAPALHLGRPGLRLSTGVAGGIQPVIVSTSAEAVGGYRPGDLLIAGHEVTANNSGRAEIRMSSGGDLSVAKAFGPDTGTGMEVQGAALILRGRRPLAYAARDQFALHSGEVTQASTAIWGMTYAAPVPSGRRRAFAKADGISPCYASTRNETASGVEVYGVSRDGTNNHMSAHLLAVWTD